MSPPGRAAFTAREWDIIQSHRTPLQVQRFLRRLPYNWEEQGETLRSFRQVVRLSTAHCLEAALTAAVILEQHGYAPRLLSLESQDKLDHVIFVFQEAGRWGAVARSRDLGLHGRKPIYRNIRHLACSYFDPYVDQTARLTGYGMANLRELGNYDWRLSTRNLWRVERHLCDMRHSPFNSSERRYRKLLKLYYEHKRRYPDRPLTYFSNRHSWLL
ncbi:MAG: hypothetical protein HY650_10095 [Acidobacteria bacterium]|nr:hypothetical protein [Acidobacteriota bacterium]